MIYASWTKCTSQYYPYTYEKLQNSTAIQHQLRLHDHNVLGVTGRLTIDLAAILLVF